MPASVVEYETAALSGPPICGCERIDPVFALLPIVDLANGALYVLGVVCARSSTTFVLRHGAEL
jgi:hypothetical protein